MVNNMGKTKNVHARLSEARQNFHALELRKSGRFPGGRGNYFELGDFIIPALKVLHDAGLNGYVSFTDKIAMLRIVSHDDPADEIVFTSPLGSANLKGCHEVQNIGAVQTYQRRYLWMAALEIVEHDAIEPTTGEAGGHSQEDAVSPQPADEWGPRPKGEKPTKTDLDRILKEVQHELEGCGDEDELTAYLQTPEYKDRKAVLEEHRPSALYGPAPAFMPEFVPLKELVNRKVKMFRMAAQEGQPEPNNMMAG